MNILRHSKHKLLGGAAVCLTGLLTASLAFAGGSHSGSGKGKDRDRDRDRDKTELRIKNEKFEVRDRSLRATATVTGFDTRCSSSGQGKGHGSCGQGHGSCGQGHGSCGQGGKGSKGKVEEDIRVKLSATAEVKVSCLNPAGIKVPGKTDRFDFDLDGSAKYKERDIRRGELRISVETDKLRDKDIEYASSCPHKWTTKIESVEFLDADLEVRHGKDSARLLCTFYSGDKKGSIHNVKCVEY
jgi:hypothetical protein